MNETKMERKQIDRKQATADLRVYHQSTFNALGIPDAIFIPKMAHYVKGAQGIHVGFFDSELNHEQDIYIEKVNINLESEDPNRTLYKVKFNPYFKEEYFAPVPLDGKPMKYFVPVEEMEVVPVNVKKTTTKGKKDVPLVITNDPNLDLPIDQMTMRDVACIKLRVPSSFKPWLNELIKESLKTNK